MLASQENVSDNELLCVADTMLSLGTEVIAPNPAPQTLSNPSLSRVRNYEKKNFPQATSV